MLAAQPRSVVLAVQPGPTMRRQGHYRNEMFEPLHQPLPGPHPPL
jgi:hypothetical protein